MRIAAAAFALVLACGACAGAFTPSQPYDAPDGSITPVGNGGGGPDSGYDAGSPPGSDAGTDGGCTALSANGLAVVDGCLGMPATATASISVTPPGCTAFINITTGTACSGVAIGPSDAFDGGCGNIGAIATCRSSSLPGTINCGSCSIVFCDGGTCP